MQSKNPPEERKTYEVSTYYSGVYYLCYYMNLNRFCPIRQSRYLSVLFDFYVFTLRIMLYKIRFSVFSVF